MENMMIGFEIPVVAVVAGTFGLGCVGGVAAGCVQAQDATSVQPPLLSAALSSVTPSSAIGCWVCMNLVPPPFPGRHFFSCVDNMGGSSARFVMCSAIFVCFSGVLGYCLGECSGNIAYQSCCRPSNVSSESQPLSHSVSHSVPAVSEELPGPPSSLPWRSSSFQGAGLHAQLSIPSQ